MSFQINLKKTKITINGQTYSSPAEMPPEVRAQYDKAMAMIDRNGNGVPDAFEGKNRAELAGKTITTRRIFINGKEYEPMEDVPAEQRHLIEEALAKPGAAHGQIARQESKVRISMTFNKGGQGQGTLFGLSFGNLLVIAAALAAAVAVIVWVMRS